MGPPMWQWTGKGCAQCVWVCDNMAKNNAIKMIMIDQLPKAALTDNITYGEKSTTAVLASPSSGKRRVSRKGKGVATTTQDTREKIIVPDRQGFILRPRPNLAFRCRIQVRGCYTGFSSRTRKKSSKRWLVRC